jgi:hypothetical protein
MVGDRNIPSCREVAAQHYFCTHGRRTFHLPVQFLEQVLPCLRSDLGLFLQGIPDVETCHGVFEAGHERIIHRLQYNEAFRRDTALSGVVAARHGSRMGCLIKVRVRENDKGIASSQLYDGLFSSLPDVAAT